MCVCSFQCLPLPLPTLFFISLPPYYPPPFTLQLQRHYSQAWLLYGAGHLNSVLTLPDQALYQLNLLLVLF